MDRERSEIKEIKKLQEELKKARSQLYLFYELTQAMRTSLKLDEIAYIVLTSITSHQGLGYNRALLFLVDEKNSTINGFMGIGPLDAKEAEHVWKSIEQQRMGLYDLIAVYNEIKKSEKKPPLLEIMRSLKFSLEEKDSLLYTSLYDINPKHIKKDNLYLYQNDPIVNKFKLEEFVAVPLWTKDKPIGVIIVDNFVTHKPIEPEEIRILYMFANQAAYAIENSRIFEETLIKAHTDPLTSLWNYGYFQYKLDEIFNLSLRNNSPFSIIMFDLDDFKKFNDTFGHQEGDNILREIANTLRNVCRPQDIICRYGGEEFSIILPNTDIKEAFFIAEEIRKTIEKKEINNKNITVSLGVSTCNNPQGEKKEDVLRRADISLYRAKKEGKNRTIVG